MSVVRFYWAQLRVGGPRHVVVTPRARNPVEADLTKCGQSLRAGMKWWFRPRGLHKKDYAIPRVCKHCC